MELKFLEKFNVSREPLVVGVPSSLDLFNLSPSDQAMGYPCHLVEARLDLLSDEPASNRIDEAVSNCPLPVLFTARHPDEGGRGNLTPAQRADLLRRHIPSAWGVDIELRSYPDLADVAEQAKESEVLVVGSFHDFEGTPDLKALREVVSKGESLGVDIVKIATTLRSSSDLSKLMQLFDTEAETPLAIMGMGDLGKVSRLVLAKCGSALSYGFLGDCNVEGQWPARELMDLMARI